MHLRKSLSPLSAAIAIAALAGLAQAAGVADQPTARPTAVQAFERANPGARFYNSAGRITSVYGEAFSLGDTAVQSAENFLAQYAAMFSVRPEQLVPGSLAGDGAHVREIMPDLETGAMRFTLVSYLQTHDGIPVFRGNIRLLTRNEQGSPLVLVRSGLRNLGNFRADNAVAEKPNVEGAFADAMFRFPGMVDFSAPDVVIFAGVDEENAPARLAVTFIGTIGDATQANYQKWRIVADAATGKIIWTENQINQVDVTGSVKGMFTPGKKADICETEILANMPYARAAIGATVAYADVNGNFTIPNAGSTNVTVESGVRGRWFRVWNNGAEPELLTQNVTPPGPANFVHNSPNSNATHRSGVNAYIQSNIVRDYTLFYSPTYPTITGQTEWRVNINVSGTCNAFYDGSSINFYPAGGGCPSTAFGDVVHHEYGHHLVNVAGSGQGAYGEGMGDVVGVLISDDPILGYGFQNNCAAGIRNASNNHQYPCSGEIHDCGQLISGCVWSTRNALIITNPSTYRDILANLAINAMLLHDGTAINPQITIDYLTLDDNNANITDGTPHYSEIAQGFGAHNMDAPPLSLLAFTYPSGRPTLIGSQGGEMFTVQVSGLSGTPQANTGVLYVDHDSNGSFDQYPMSQISTNVYSAAFPAITCGNNVRYYVSARTTTDILVTDPQNAPSAYYTAISGSSLTNVLTDNFETNLGWTATADAGVTGGQWQRAVPTGQGQRGDPPTDGDGSGSCYLTQNGGAGSNTDVDGGTVTLTSPTVNLGGGGQAYVSYSRWYSNDFGGDPNNDVFVVQASNNNGATWTTLETVGPAGPEASGGWNSRTFNLGSFVTLSSQMRVRFQAADLGTGSVVEAAVDGVRFQLVECACPGDYDGDGFVTGVDYDLFVGDFEAGNMDADFDGDGFLTGTDFDLFVGAFEAPC